MRTRKKQQQLSKAFDKAIARLTAPVDDSNEPYDDGSQAMAALTTKTDGTARTIMVIRNILLPSDI